MLKQFWHEKDITNKREDYVFFKESLKTKRKISNMKEEVTIPLKTDATVKKMTLHFRKSSKLDDINRLLDILVFRFFVENDVYRWIHFKKIDNYNYQIEQEIFIPKNTTFYPTIYFNPFVEIGISEAVPVTVVLDIDVDCSVESPMSAMNTLPCRG